MERIVITDLVFTGVIILFLVVKAKRDWKRYQRLKNMEHMSREDRLLCLLFGKGEG